MLAMLCFALANIFNAILSAEVGPFCYFYLLTGALIVCLVQHGYASFKQMKNNQKCWVDWNFIVNGQLRLINVLGFVCLSLLMFMMENSINLSLWTASLARMNAGVIAVIWSMTPLL